jgi:hypothetical protein
MYVATEEIKKGDLVSYVDKLGSDYRLFGVVVDIVEEIGRARVFWQNYDCFKMVELKNLRIVRACQRKRETLLGLQN